MINTPSMNSLQHNLPLNIFLDPLIDTSSQLVPTENIRRMSKIPQTCPLPDIEEKLICDDNFSSYFSDYQVKYSYPALNSTCLFELKPSFGQSYLPQLGSDVNADFKQMSEI